MPPKNLTRRQFGLVLSAAALAPVTGQRAFGGPLLDLHQHTLYSGRTNEQLLAHQDHHQVTTTVLLPGAGWMFEQLGGNEDCAGAQGTHPEKFVRFACADAAESRAVDILNGNLDRGAIGIGEMKFQVAVDSPEMHRVYQLAEERAVPVLIHFQFETYNTGIKRFAKVLERYPRVNFIGHAQTWWGNISADLDPLVMYPQGPVKPGGLTDRLLSDYPNIYGDLSAGSGLNSIARDPEFARGFLDRHQRRLIWGSDCNCHDGRGTGIRRGNCIAERSLAILGQLLPDQHRFRRITYENAARLLGLQPSRV